MHGQPRKASTPEDEKASALKAAKLRSLQSQFLLNHQNKIFTKEALDVSAKLLETNPEFYTAWNYRKLAVQHNLNQSESETDPDFIESILKEELRVAESALRTNFKSYGAWHHRKWVLSKGYSLADREMQLLEVFQKRDGRNFHAWNYRRFVAALKNRSEVEELQFTTDMINTNFSNYSAWHNRSVLLSRLLGKKAEGFFPKEKVLTDEYDLVHQAIFTDPDDQSGWFYHLWLLDQTVKVDTPLLVSSWPSHGADLNILVESGIDGCDLSPFTSFHPSSGTFPLILYFSEAVEAVNSSTVIVESAYDANKDLIWRPLSMNTYGSAQSWVTHLSFPTEKSTSVKSYPVKVSIGHSLGIISSSGFRDAQPSCCEFTVSIQPHDTKHGERRSVERIYWREENFHHDEKTFHPSNPIKYFNQLTIDKDPTTSKWNLETVAKEIDLFRELLCEIDCKIGKLSLGRLLTARDAMMLNNRSPDEYTMFHSEEVLKLYSDLMKLDQPHYQYYKDEHSLVLLQQVTSSRGSLLRHCCRYKESSISSNICLRLSNLSLSRIGSIEKLLWVQMLDLSHNLLHSIEGLEAMQLLSCLNLSHNKLASFTALEPLRLLTSLKVLDISHNEIGAHSVDTRRYLCSSPLSHTAESEWKFDEFVISSAMVANYWEAFFIFRSSKLTQLDIAGNAISDDKFKSFLFKLLPSLEALDGDSR